MQGAARRLMTNTRMQSVHHRDCAVSVSVPQVALGVRRCSGRVHRDEQKFPQHLQC